MLFVGATLTLVVVVAVVVVVAGAGVVIGVWSSVNNGLMGNSGILRRAPLNSKGGIFKDGNWKGFCGMLIA